MENNCSCEENILEETMEQKELLQILVTVRPFVVHANQLAEALHDDLFGDMYMDISQYQIMCETAELLKNIDMAIASLSSENETTYNTALQIGSKLRFKKYL